MLIIVKIAAKKFHWKKAPTDYAQPMGDMTRKTGKGGLGGRKQQAASRDLQELDELRRVE